MNPRKDMRRLATLIEMAFGGDLDEPGRQMVRDMRTLGRLGWVGWALSTLVLPPAAHPKGFVWEQAGEVVGNASLLQVAGYPKRWVLANVAVHPDHRRQGIGRAMVRAAIDMAREARGSELLLQVRSDRSGTLSMYLDLGFKPLATRTTWKRTKSPWQPPPGMPATIRRRRKGEWRDQWLLAQRCYPEGVIWPYPLSARFFRQGDDSAFGPGEVRHWVLYEAGRLVGSAAARRANQPRTWRIVLLVNPGGGAQVEHALAAHAMSNLPLNRSSLLLDYPSGHSRDALRSLGFHAVRTLTWMALDLAPGGAS